MGVNLEGRYLRRLHQREPVSGWGRQPDDSFAERPLRIYTLGRFSVELLGRNVSDFHTRQHRPLELLQVLIALGGRNVGAGVICQALWPDADGDLAENSFDVTLHRLRRLFGVSDLLLLNDHRLTLNSSLTWVDVWTFERLVNYAERLIPCSGDPLVMRQLARASERLMQLYQGNFLEREAVAAWSLTLRERLRSKLLRHILDVGRTWEANGDLESAIRLYRKGLEIDPLIESFYQQLMICLGESGRRAEAIAVFRQCREILNSQLHIAPSAQTLTLYNSLAS
jgi:DNA-binding SARP family transcriptional activator